MTRRNALPLLAPGTTVWYGKVPARGDFVSHGLAPSHTRAWDGWLQSGLRLAERRWAPAELERRLRTFPAWRFLAWPDGLASPVWAGVLVASHDRVGRAFPLAVVEVVEPARLSGMGWLAIEAAMARMADAALDATDANDAQTAENFEPVLRALGPVFAERRAAARPAAGRARRQQSPLDLLRSSPGTRSLWWSEPAPAAAPLPLGDRWLPHAELLLDILALPDDPG